MWELTLGASAFAMVAAQATQDPLIEWLSRAGSIGILAAACIAFLRGWIVSGKAYDEVRAERDRALDLVYKQAGLAHRAVDLTAERLGLDAEVYKLGEERQKGGP